MVPILPFGTINKQTKHGATVTHCNLLCFSEADFQISPVWLTSLILSHKPVPQSVPQNCARECQCQRQFHTSFPPLHPHDKPLRLRLLKNGFLHIFICVKKRITFDLGFLKGTYLSVLAEKSVYHFILTALRKLNVNQPLQRSPFIGFFRRNRWLALTTCQKYEITYTTKLLILWSR